VYTKQSPMIIAMQSMMSADKVPPDKALNDLAVAVQKVLDKEAAG